MKDIPGYEGLYACLKNIENRPQVNHINGVKTDNRLENLEWCTCSQNQLHSFMALGKKSRGGEKKGIIQFKNDLSEIKRFSSISDAVISTGVCQSNISRVALGLRKTAGGFIWKYV